MKKIAIISDFHPNEVLGGGGLIAYEFFQKLLNANYEVEFWYTSKEDSKFGHSEYIVGKSKVPTNFIARYFFQNIGFSRLREFAKLIRDNNPEIIWFHQVGKQIPFSSILFATIFKKKVIITLHDFLAISTTKVAPLDLHSENLLAMQNVDLTHDIHSKIRRWVNRKSINCAKSVIAVSEMQASILKAWDIRVDETINNGIQICQHGDIKNSMMRESATILFAGRFHRKGLQQTLESASNYPFPLRVLLAGESDLAEFASSNFPSVDFEFLGLLDRNQVSEKIHESDLVFVLSQYFDPFPTIALEAAKHGKPFVCTNTSGVADLIPLIHRKDLVFKVGEIPNLENVLCYLSNYPELSNLISEKIKDIDTVLDIYISKLNEL